MPAPNKFPANIETAPRRNTNLYYDDDFRKAGRLRWKWTRNAYAERNAFAGPNELAYMLRSGPFEMRNIPIGMVIVVRVLPIHIGVKCTIKTHNA